VQRRYESFYSPAVGREMRVLAFGHYGMPLIAFPSGGGEYYDFENNGMVEAIRHLIEDAKVKLYCCESLDRESWLDQGIDPHWRAVRYHAYQDYLVKDLVPAIYEDCRTPGIGIGLVGCSLGAYHAANFALKFPHLFPYALCMSGRYDLENITSASGSEDVYFNNPLAYVYHLHGEALEQVRRHTRLVLVCGQGAWEEKCLTDTRRLAELLAQKGIPCELDLWGFDVEHHWYWWQKQFAYHLGRRLGFTLSGQG
jgi:esterase/lipase superfamily enzyme